MIETNNRIREPECEESEVEIQTEDTPLVSIIIPVYNGSNYLQEAIDSALAQTYRACEVIVVNDGSNDGGRTESVALSYKNRIRYFYKENGGVASALNFAIKQMKGEYFSWLSHDDLYAPDKIKKEMEAIKEHANSDQIVFSSSERLYVETGHTVGPSYQNLFRVKELENSVFPVLVGEISGCTVLFHKKYFAEVGNFNEQLRTTQDYDFWFRLFRHRKTIFLEEKLVISRIHKEQGSKTIIGYQQERKNLYLSFLEQLTDNEKEQMFGSKKNFYPSMADALLRINVDDICIQYLLKKWEKEVNEDGWMDSSKIIQEWIKQNFSKSSGEIYLFGAGKIGLSMLKRLLLRNIKIKGIIDNSKGKQGKRFENIPCVPLQEVDKKAIIFICVLEAGCILAQLDHAGYANRIEYTKLTELLEKVPIGKRTLARYCERKKQGENKK